jgi:hypothetical protein
MRKTCLLIFLTLFCLNLFGVEKQAGYSLLDKVISTFKGMAEKGTGGREKVIPALEEMMADAKKAKDQEQIDPVFFNRYNRLLMVMKLLLVEDEEGILRPVVEREVGDFVWDVEGIKLDGSGKKNIGYVSEAIADELINLHLYLDNIEKKQELRKKLEGMDSGEKKK